MANSFPYTDYAFIAIGANLPSEMGDPLESIAFAFNALAPLSVKPVLQSSVYITSPVDSPSGTPDFYNAMAGIYPKQSETPLSLLHRLQAIENHAGRQRSGIANEARTLDLDLITFRSEMRDTEELTLPHPRAHERKFVLVPLLEITGSGFRLPGKTMSLQSLLAKVPHGQEIKRL